MLTGDVQAASPEGKSSSLAGPLSHALRNGPVDVVLDEEFTDPVFDRRR